MARRRPWNPAANRSTLRNLLWAEARRAAADGDHERAAAIRANVRAGMRRWRRPIDMR